MHLDLSVEKASFHSLHVVARARKVTCSTLLACSSKYIANQYTVFCIDNLYAGVDTKGSKAPKMAMAEKHFPISLSAMTRVTMDLVMEYWHICRKFSALAK